MKTLLQQLENESLLLLYMAGELPIEDRKELELMLKADGGLRAQLESLRVAEAASIEALIKLDIAEPLRAPDLAMRQVGRAMQQWQIDRLARPAKTAAARSSMPIWAWSAGSAVAAVLVFCIWWGFRSDAPARLADTQPIIPAMPNPGGFADRTTAYTNDAPLAAPAIPDAVQVVATDTNTQRLGDLESVVSEDFTRE